MSDKRHVIVVGGGAAGMMAAISAGAAGCRVSLYEKNEKLGKKLFITGKGRCNVTNACGVEELLQAAVTNRKFLYSSFYGFTNQDMMALLEQAGLRLKTERGGRVFPASDRSSDVIGALERLLHRQQAEIHLRCRVTGLAVEEENGAVCRGIYWEQGGKQEFAAADQVILATGGLSYPSTGSTGDGYEWARKAGHRITPLSPALVPFETAEQEEARELQGLSLRNVEIGVFDGKRELYRGFGEMLFTHFGVSGPLLLSASSFAAKAISKHPLRLVIDLKPALTREQLDERILRDFSGSLNKQFKNALGQLYPAKLIPIIIKRSGIDPDKKVNEITRAERQSLIQATKELSFTLTGLRDFKEAIITQGGVDVRDVSPSTMESRKVRGLYFAGEILDLDAVTGGFNLQIAWSTGWAAGRGETIKS